jgi:hypothetical protein
MKEYEEKWNRDQRFERERELAWETGDLEKIKELYNNGTPVRYRDMDLAKAHPHVCVWLASVGLTFYWYGEHYFLLLNHDTGELEVVNVAWTGKRLIVVEVYDEDRSDKSYSFDHVSEGWYEYNKKVHNFKD